MAQVGSLSVPSAMRYYLGTNLMKVSPAPHFYEIRWPENEVWDAQFMTKAPKISTFGETTGRYTDLIPQLLQGAGLFDHS